MTRWVDAVAQQHGAINGRILISTFRARGVSTPARADGHGETAAGLSLSRVSRAPRILADAVRDSRAPLLAPFALLFAPFDTLDHALWRLGYSQKTRNDPKRCSKPVVSLHARKRDSRLRCGSFFCFYFTHPIRIFAHISAARCGRCCVDLPSRAVRRARDLEMSDKSGRSDRSFAFESH